MYYSNLAIVAAFAAVSSLPTANASGLHDTVCVFEILDFLHPPGPDDVGAVHRRYECNNSTLILNTVQEGQVEDSVTSRELFPGRTVIGFDRNLDVETVGNDIHLPEGDFISFITETNPPQQRRGPEGILKSLIVKVYDSTGSSVSESLQQLSERMWGPEEKDHINTRNQFSACSHGMIDFQAGPHGDDNSPGVIEVTLDIPFNGSTSLTVLNASKAAAKAKLGFSLPGIYSYIMFAITNCYGAGCGWAAYAYFDRWDSVYVKSYITFPAVVMHEIGHNFGLHHSGENGQTYTDHSCLMGNPLFGEDLGKMCYNAPKSWQIGWYDEPNDKIYVDIKDNLIWEGRLIGVADYVNQNRNGESILVRIDVGAEDDYFLNFNRAIGMNSQNKEASNMVNVYSQQGNGESTAVSMIIGKLEQGNTWERTLNGHTVTVNVKVIDLDASPGFAAIQVCIDQCAPADPTASPTSNPTAPNSSFEPTTYSSQDPTPSLSESDGPTKDDPTATPTTIPSDSPTGHPSDSPTANPTKPKNVCKKMEEEDDCEGLGCHWKLKKKGGKCKECNTAKKNKKCGNGGCVWEKDSENCVSCNEEATTEDCYSQSCVWTNEMCLSCRAGSPSENECNSNGCVWKRKKCVSCREMPTKKKCRKSGCAWNTDTKVCDSILSDGRFIIL